MSVALPDTGSLNLIVQVAVDSVAVSNWPQLGPDSIAVTDIPELSHLRTWGPSFLAALSVVLAAVLAYALRSWYRRNGDRRRAYVMLATIVGEMERGLERTWYCLNEFGQKSSFNLGAFSDIARETCLPKLVEVETDLPVLDILFPFYDNLRLIAMYQEMAIRYSHHTVRGTRAHMMALVYMQDKCLEMTELLERARDILALKARKIGMEPRNRPTLPEGGPARAAEILASYRKRHEEFNERIRMEEAKRQAAAQEKEQAD